MPIDIGMGFGYDDYEHRFTFKPDVYHSVLANVFKVLEERTGKFIDIYGAVFFRFSEIEQLESLIKDAEQLVEKSPKTWEQYVGTRTTFPNNEALTEKVYETANTDELVSLISDLKGVVKEAKASKKGVSFIGD